MSKLLTFLFFQLILFQPHFLMCRNETPPKIAMFFSGRIKSYEYTTSYLLDFIKKHSPDVFCSINAELDAYSDSFIKQFNVKKFIFKKFEFPQDLVITNIDSASLFNVCSMFKNHKNCIDLISDYQDEHHFIYDLVIYMRADILPTHSFDFELIFDDRLHIPNDPVHVAINDQLAYGSFSIMSRYCSLFDYLDNYCNKYKVPFNPETLLKFHLDHFQIPITHFEFSYTLNKHRHE